MKKSELETGLREVEGDISVLSSDAHCLRKRVKTLEDAREDWTGRDTVTAINQRAQIKQLQDLLDASRADHTTDLGLRNIHVAQLKAELKKMTEESDRERKLGLDRLHDVYRLNGRVRILQDEVKLLEQASKMGRISPCPCRLPGAVIATRSDDYSCCAIIGWAAFFITLAVLIAS